MGVLLVSISFKKRVEMLAFPMTTAVIWLVIGSCLIKVKRTYSLKTPM